MNIDDLKYVCNVMGDLSGIPIRIYENKELIHYHSIIKLPIDPICLYLDTLFNITEHIGYYITPIFNYYGVVNSNQYSIMFGPTRLLPADDQLFHQQAFDLGLNKDDTIEFINGMKSIINMPLESIMEMLCVLNYLLNNEKKTIKELSIVDFSQNIIKEKLETIKVANDFNKIDTPIDSSTHNTLDIENQLMDIISKGDTIALKEYVDSLPAIRGGILAKNDIRHLKNTFIVSTSLAARAAIRGGVSPEDALSLSDAYIQNCEIETSHSGVYNLQFRMIFDFTERVERIKKEKINSKLSLDVLNYIHHHLSEPINTQNIADALFISRSGLSTKFKQETGKNLTTFLMEVKLDEAKKLLKYTDKSILTISEYLGFSSQSHFNHTFYKYIEMTPLEYRKKHSN